MNEIRTHDILKNDEPCDGGWRMADGWRVEGKMDEDEDEDEDKDRKERKSGRARE